jgi:hypothetical protein
MTAGQDETGGTRLAVARLYPPKPRSDALLQLNQPVCHTGAGFSACSTSLLSHAKRRTACTMSRPS